MKYSEKHIELKSLFESGAKVIMVPNSRVRICSSEFHSGEPEQDFLNEEDSVFSENSSFSYPVFTPPSADSSKVILLLHGLNERNWLKYLAWSYYLSEETNSYVILFPMSFHINRSPESWKDPRIMANEVEKRSLAQKDIRMTSFANVALSKRLSDDPRRFFFSGYRTALDITTLLDSIRKGEHDIIPVTGSFNIFSYSIGAFLAEILMMANPKSLFSSSRLFMFCGGSVFSRMRGTSKLIMDSLAFDSIFGYYLDDFEKIISQRKPLYDFFNTPGLGLAFRSMIDIERFKGFREKVIKEMRDRIHVIALLKDRVIPVTGVLDTLDCFSSGKVVELADFPYDYSHENPFPVTGNATLSNKVDECFERVMSASFEFFT